MSSNRLPRGFLCYLERIIPLTKYRDDHIRSLNTLSYSFITENKLERITIHGVRLINLMRPDF